MKINRKSVEESFTQYTDHYDPQDLKIRLKVEHTFHVAKLCDQIARSLNLTEEDVDLAWLMGMLHDLGRFEQLRQYGTFSDADSIDHAKLAVRLLFEEGMIEEYLPADELFDGGACDGLKADRPKESFQKDIASDLGSGDGLAKPDTGEGEVAGKNRREDEILLLRIAIANHSAYQLEQGLSRRAEQFCHILRDADKLDIFRVIAEMDMDEIYHFSPGQLAQSGVSQEVVQAFRERHAVLRSLKKKPADYVIGNAALAFELVFPMSRRLAVEQGYLKKILNFSSDNPETRKLFEELHQCIGDYLGVPMVTIHGHF